MFILKERDGMLKFVHHRRRWSIMALPKLLQIFRMSCGFTCKSRRISALQEELKSLSGLPLSEHGLCVAFITIQIWNFNSMLGSRRALYKNQAYFVPWNIGVLIGRKCHLKLILV